MGNNNNAEDKKKKNYFKRMHSAVKAHVKDVFTDLVKTGVKNADELHGVKVKTQQKLDDIVKDVFKRTQETKGGLKVKVDEVKGVIKSAYKQAIGAVLHEASEGDIDGVDEDNFDLEEDDFLKEFDMDFDDDDDIGGDDDDSDDSNDDDNEVGNESYIYSVEGVDQSSMAAEVTLFYKKLILIYMASKHSSSKFKSYWDFMMARSAEPVPSLFGVMSQVPINDVEFKPSNPVDTTNAINVIKDVSETIADLNPNIGVEDVDSDPSVPVAAIPVDESQERDIQSLGVTVKDSLLPKIRLDVSNNEEYRNRLEAIYYMIDRTYQMYAVANRIPMSEENELFAREAIIDLLGVPELDIVLILEFHLAEESTIETAQKCVTLFREYLINNKEE